MAHEIKNPLTPIKLSAQRIEHYIKNNSLDEKNIFSKCTEAIVRQVNNIEGLVSEFSNFARMPSGKFKNIQLNKIIEPQINSQKSVHKKAKFNFRTTNENISVNCDYQQLSRVFLNLMKNSFESIKKKRKNYFNFCYT